MLKYNIALFDLDGTITDSSAGITRSVAYALEKRGYPKVKPENLKHFIGPPLREEFMSFCGVDEAEGTELVKAYRERYANKGIFECSVYEGVPALLMGLKDAGFTILLATSKPETFAKRILEHFHLEEYFDFVGGALLDNTRTAKHEVIAYILDSAGIAGQTENTVMIGDCTQDIEGAAKLGIGTVSVTYGFGKKDELAAQHPLALCDTPREVYDYLCGNTSKRV